MTSLSCASIHNLCNTQAFAARQAVKMRRPRAGAIIAVLALALPPHALVANAFAVAATSTATTFVVRNPVNRVKRQFLGVEQKRGSFWHGGSSAGRSNECAGGVTSMASPVCCLGSIGKKSHSLNVSKRMTRHLPFTDCMYLEEKSNS